MLSLNRSGLREEGVVVLLKPVLVRRDAWSRNRRDSRVRVNGLVLVCA
jgi:hypothetical protein